MNYQEAKGILKALIEGRDPISGDDLPLNSVLQNVSVVRALVFAQESMQANSDRQKRREALPERVGVSWTTEEDEQLTAEWKSEVPLERIADAHDRTIRAIESRLEKLKLITAGQRRTSTSFGGSSAPSEVDGTQQRNGRRSGPSGRDSS